MPKKLKQNGEPELHEKLKEFKIAINEFGEIVDTFGKEKLNQFLNAMLPSSPKTEEE